MQRVHQLIEAQKNFLRFYEMREKLAEKHREEEAAATAAAAMHNSHPFFPPSSSAGGVLIKETKPFVSRRRSAKQDSNDSDKENSSVASQKQQRPSRKIAKLADVEAPSSSSSSTSDGVRKRGCIDDNVDDLSASSAPPNKFSKMAGMSELCTGANEKEPKDHDGEKSPKLPPPPEMIDDETQTSLRDGVRIVLTSRKRFVAKLGAEHVNKKPPDSADHSTKKELVDKPWRQNMKPASGNEAKIKPEDEREKKKPSEKAPEKPWRTNMKAKSQVEAQADAENPQKAAREEPERPWRTNMKAVRTPAPPPAQPARVKRHYDRDSVRKFMLEKKKRDKQKREEHEQAQLKKQELIR